MSNRHDCFMPEMMFPFPLVIPPEAPLPGTKLYHVRGLLEEILLQHYQFFTYFPNVHKGMGGQLSKVRCADQTELHQCGLLHSCHPDQ